MTREQYVLIEDAYRLLSREAADARYSKEAVRALALETLRRLHPQVTFLRFRERMREVRP